MGQGKTTVIAPLLALHLGNGKDLVMQVMPASLLPMSREVLRDTFSFAMPKKTYTFTCARSDEITSFQLKKLLRVAKDRGVVVSNPTSVKSLLLRFIENLLQFEDGKSPQNRQKVLREMELLGQILEFFRRGNCIVDEVDLVMNPLTSELNFPIGNREPLSPSPDRWRLPMHIFELILLAANGATSKKQTQKQGDEAMLSLKARQLALVTEQIDQLREIINVAVRRKKMQQAAVDGDKKRCPVLLDTDSYFKPMGTGKQSMLETLAYCVTMWLREEAVHMSKSTEDNSDLTTDEMIAYLIEPNPDTGTAPNLQSFLDKALKDENFVPGKRKLLVLARNWLQVYLPHCLKKINRVSFGLMNEEEYARFIRLEPLMPESRSKLAIPFVGKDTPAPASEFAHPDIMIGLSVIAYRIEYLRLEDMHDIIKILQVKFRQEVAYPKRKRPTYLLYADWVDGVPGASICDTGSCNFLVKEKRVPPLDVLKPSNEEEMGLVFEILKSSSAVIDYFMDNILFPKFMKFQKVKLHASAQEIGSQVMFKNRLGFSGTPSNVIPKLLGDCEFEPGSQARIIATMTEGKIVNHEFVESGWTAKSILTMIAQARDSDGVSAKYNALIDTGALVTGLSNLQVAEYLLFEAGLPVKGVTFLDGNDDKKVLVYESKRVVSYNECGIPLEHRFAFYDQTHTTGMDIK